MHLIQLWLWKLWDNGWLKQAIIRDNVLPEQLKIRKLIFYKCICKFPTKWNYTFIKNKSIVSSCQASVLYGWLNLITKIWSIFYLLNLYMNKKSFCVCKQSCWDADDCKDSRLGYSCSAFYQPSGDKWFRGSKVFIAIQIKENHSASELPWSVLLGGGVEGLG